MSVNNLKEEMSIPAPPSFEVYQASFVDEDGFYITGNVICTMCAERMERKTETFELQNVPPPDMGPWNDLSGFAICCCLNCETEIDNIIQAIFANYPNINNFPKNFIKTIWPTKIMSIINNLYTHGYISINDPNNEVVFAYNMLRSKEYRLLYETLKSMSIWCKPEVKL